MADEKDKSERDAQDEKKVADEKVDEKTVDKKDEKRADDGDERDAHIKKLNEENKKHRLEAKAAKERLDKFEKALGIATGKEKESIDPVLEERKRSDDRLKRAILKAEFGGLVRDAHDTNALFRLMGDELADIGVDVDKETVDRPSLEKKITEIRKSHGWMFQPKEDKKSNSSGGKLPLDKGNGTSSESSYSTYRNLKDAGRSAEAQEFYAKNKASILMSMPK